MSNHAPTATENVNPSSSPFPYDPMQSPTETRTHKRKSEISLQSDVTQRVKPSDSSSMHSSFTPSDSVNRNFSASLSTAGLDSDSDSDSNAPDAHMLNPMIHSQHYNKPSYSQVKEYALCADVMSLIFQYLTLSEASLIPHVSREWARILAAMQPIGFHCQVVVWAQQFIPASINNHVTRIDLLSPLEASKLFLLLHCFPNVTWLTNVLLVDSLDGQLNRNLNWNLNLLPLQMINHLRRLLVSVFTDQLFQVCFSLGLLSQLQELNLSFHSRTRAQFEELSLSEPGLLQPLTQLIQLQQLKIATDWTPDTRIQPALIRLLSNLPSLTALNLFNGNFKPWLFNSSDEERPIQIPLPNIKVLHATKMLFDEWHNPITSMATVTPNIIQLYVQIIADHVRHPNFFTTLNTFKHIAHLNISIRPIKSEYQYSVLSRVRVALAYCPLTSLEISGARSTTQDFCRMLDQFPQLQKLALSDCFSSLEQPLDLFNLVARVKCAQSLTHLTIGHFDEPVLEHCRNMNLSTSFPSLISLGIITPAYFTPYIREHQPIYFVNHFLPFVEGCERMVLKVYSKDEWFTKGHGWIEVSHMLTK